MVDAQKDQLELKLVRRHEFKGILPPRAGGDVLSQYFHRQGVLESEATLMADKFSNPITSLYKRENFSPERWK